LLNKTQKLTHHQSYHVWSDEIFAEGCRGRKRALVHTLTQVAARYAQDLALAAPAAVPSAAARRSPSAPPAHTRATPLPPPPPTPLIAFEDSTSGEDTHGNGEREEDGTANKTQFSTSTSSRPLEPWARARARAQARGPSARAQLSQKESGARLEQLEFLASRVSRAL